MTARNSIALMLFLVSSATAFQLPRSKSPLAIRKSTANDDMHHDDSIVADNSRRSLWTQSLTAASASTFAAAIATSFPSTANAADLQTFDDPDYGFRFLVPTSWEQSVQILSGRRKAVFFVDPSSGSSNGGSSTDTLLFVAYTPVRDDFTSLGSFGSVDQVAQTTILPKGELAGVDDTSKMLSAVSKNNAYYFDYVASPVVPTEPGSSEASRGQMTKQLEQQHFRTIYTLLPLKNGGGAGLTLVTITVQTTEEKYGGLKVLFDEIVDSYGKIPK